MAGLPKAPSWTRQRPPAIASEWAGEGAGVGTTEPAREAGAAGRCAAAEGVATGTLSGGRGGEETGAAAAICVGGAGG